MKLITKELLDTVTKQAQAHPRLRMNYNLHDSLSAPIHRLLNVLEPDTYLPPHRHPDKEETYMIVRGNLLTFFYDDNGNITLWTRLNPADGYYGIEVPPNTWHNIVSLESGTTIFEVKSGPYMPLAPEDIAPWAPKSTDAEGIARFRQQLLASISMDK
ncbi:MAG: WbuC family cupin fold metalloprotein [Prevotellaceae bacterium]|jgi:cupin fold WbuC family metalloprotein|nr:WbuC family cupin fold metalloprotein [Prevotellaceae bacterium]